MRGRIKGYRQLHDGPPEVLLEYDTVTYRELWKFGDMFPELIPVPDTTTMWVEVSQEWCQANLVGKWHDKEFFL